MSLTVGSVWEIVRQGGPNRRIRITAADEITFTAVYENLDNDSIFTGEIWAREKQVINIKQHDQNAGYVAFQTGIQKKGSFDQEYYEGAWYDVAGHHGGTFQLMKVG